MKRLLLTLFIFFSVTVSAQNVMSLSSSEGRPGDIVEIELSVQNTDNFVAFQTEIPLDGNLTYVENSAVLYRTSGSHQLTASVVDGVLKLLAYSFPLTPFNGNEGVIATFQLKLGDNPGNYILKHNNAKISDASANALPLTTSSGNVKIISPKAEITTPTINYGHVPIRSSYNKTLTVKNTGNDVLTISNLIFSDETLSCPSFSEKNVAAGQSTSFTIVYSPVEEGAVNYRITLVSNSPVEPFANVTADPYAVNEIHLDEASGTSEDIIDFNVSVNNMTPITAFQFSIKMPSALQYQNGSIELSSRKTDHLCHANMRNDTLVVIAYSPSNEAFLAEDGVIASFKLKIQGQYGYYHLYPINCILSNAQSENVISGSYSGYVNVKSPKINHNANLQFAVSSVLDTVKEYHTVRNTGSAPLRIDSVLFTDDYISTETGFPVIIENGNSAEINLICNKITEGDFSTTMKVYSNDPVNGLSFVKITGNRFEPNELVIDNEDVCDIKYLDVLVNLDNYSELTAMQADFIYPHHYYTLQGSDIELTERCSNFVKVAVPMNDSTFKIIVYSSNNSLISGNEGAVLKIRLTRIDGADNETAKIKIDNIILSDVKGNNKNSTGKCEKEIELYTTGKTELTAGWNWFSSYINISGAEGLHNLQEALTDKAIQIKTKNAFTNYNNDGSWTGTLVSVDMSNMYLIKMYEAYSLTLKGLMTDLSSTDIILGSRWNWISYPSSKDANISTALANLTPAHGDIIKTKSAFAQYDELTGWNGTLSKLTAGLGYLYYNSSDIEKTFVYSEADTKESLTENITAENNHWQTDAGKYPSNMNMVAVVKNNEEIIADCEIAVFHEDECRGSARPVFIEALDSHIVFLTVHGENNDVLTFKYYDTKSQQEYELSEHIVYTTDAVIGNIREPYTFDLSKTDMDVCKNNNVYPNPVKTNTEIYFNKMAERVELYNAVGVKIDEYRNCTKIDGIRTAGVYMVKIINNGITEYCKLIVK